jgi:hypothetical protein
MDLSLIISSYNLFLKEKGALEVTSSTPMRCQHFSLQFSLQRELCYIPINLFRNIYVGEDMHHASPSSLLELNYTLKE